MNPGRVGGGVLIALGVVFCPCHLPVTLPLLGGWLGGTALAGVVGANPGVVVLVASALFVGSVGAGWWLLSREAACDATPEPPRLGARRKQAKEVAHVTQDPR